jgi:hypothetical protein
MESLQRVKLAGYEFVFSEFEVELHYLSRATCCLQPGKLLALAAACAPCGSVVLFLALHTRQMLRARHRALYPSVSARALVVGPSTLAATVTTILETTLGQRHHASWPSS